MNVLVIVKHFIFVGRVKKISARTSLVKHWTVNSGVAGSNAARTDQIFPQNDLGHSV